MSHGKIQAELERREGRWRESLLRRYDLEALTAFIRQIVAETKPLDGVDLGRAMSSRWSIGGHSMLNGDWYFTTEPDTDDFVLRTTLVREKRAVNFRCVRAAKDKFKVGAVEVEAAPEILVPITRNGPPPAASAPFSRPASGSRGCAKSKDRARSSRSSSGNPPRSPARSWLSFSSSPATRPRRNVGSSLPRNGGARFDAARRAEPAPAHPRTHRVNPGCARGADRPRVAAAARNVNPARPRRIGFRCAPTPETVRLCPDPPMTTEQLKAMQAPLKAAYRDAPEKALVTLRAGGRISEGISCRVDTGRALVFAGLHPATGGVGDTACSGDMLLEALVACSGVTLKAVATALDLALRDAAITAEGDPDFRGTLGVANEVPVGFQKIRLTVTLETDAGDEQIATLLRLTERYCVVLQSLKPTPGLSWHRKG